MKVMLPSKFFPAAVSAVVICGSLAGCQGPGNAQSQGGMAGGLEGMESGTGSSGSSVTPQDVYHSSTADLNGDGFVTLGEVVAMKQAGLSDDQMIERLRATNQVYELTPAQEHYLRAHGVDQFVIEQIEVINRNQRPAVLSSPEGGTASPPGAVISAPLD